MAEVDKKRKAFFQFLFGELEGYLRLARIDAKSGRFTETYYPYPSELDRALEHIAEGGTRYNTYFCPHLFDSDTGNKEQVSIAPAAWADLDLCTPDKLLVEPTFVLKTSTERYQALWMFKEPMDADIAEDISKRIARHHVNDGCDQTGWDLTQLLRVPLTYNLKYQHTTGPQQVTVTQAKTELLYQQSDFNKYPELVGEESTKQDIPFPTILPDKTAEDVLIEWRSFLNPRALDLFTRKPQGDWSRALWELELSLFESGLSREEAFIVAREAACNKYARDKKPEALHWKEICRAENFVRVRNSPTLILKTDPLARGFSLVDDEERKWFEKNLDLVGEYTEWAKNLGDAAWQYHQAGAFIVLSTLLTGAVRLPTSFGTILPNLWFMLLADTTLTRKSTAMDLAVDIVSEVDSNAVLATDGSIEGLLTSLSMRPGRPSIFLRDEFSGLLEQITKRDYYSGMLETLTKLYDGRTQKRILRKETIEVKDPVVIMFAAGIKEKIMQLMDSEHVTSGFIPRFIFITAESDVTRLKPLGPPTAEFDAKRVQLIERLNEAHQHYWTPATAGPLGGNQIQMPKPWNAQLTPEAWDRYNRAEATMIDSAVKSPLKETLTPTYDRLCKSGLKAAVLLTAAKQLGDKIIVEEEDIVRGLCYVEQWRLHTMHLIENIGKTSQERRIERVFATIQSQPGILRSAIMQTYHLTARDADFIFGTLEQRGLVSAQRVGRTQKLYPTEA